MSLPRPQGNGVTPPPVPESPPHSNGAPYVCPLIIACTDDRHFNDVGQTIQSQIFSQLQRGDNDEHNDFLTHHLPPVAIPSLISPLQPGIVTFLSPNLSFKEHHIFTRLFSVAILCWSCGAGNGGDNHVGNFVICCDKTGKFSQSQKCFIFPLL